VGVIILNPAGENGIILDMSANKLMDKTFVDKLEAQIARSDVVMSVLEIPPEAALRAMELGKSMESQLFSILLRPSHCPRSPFDT
jgi:hypothetical protein